MNKAKSSILLLASVSLLAAAGCTSPAHVNGGGDSPSKTKQGDLIGGALGATFGAIFSDKKAKGALIGGAAGAAAGAGIGYSLDKQEAELREQINNEDVSITNTGSSLVVSLPDGILFPSDSAVVSNQSYQDLQTVAQSLVNHPQTTVEVVGHTDNTGSAEHNNDLSERRAESVADVLLNGGVPFERIQTFGQGENQPVASNLTEEGKAQNRRVEIVILPTGQI